MPNVINKEINNNNNKRAWYLCFTKLQYTLSSNTKLKNKVLHQNLQSYNNVAFWSTKN